MPRSLARTAAFLCPILAFASIVTLLHRVSDNLPDPDMFYHFRHAWLYRTTGVLDSSFPWVQYSVIRSCAADLWYGFHLLLIPFTARQDLLAGIELSATVWTTCALTLFFWALRRMELRWSFAWTLLFAFISADGAYRLTMLRPQPVSLALDLLLVALLTAGAASRWPRAVFPLFALGLAHAWLHASLFWVPLLITAVLWAVQLLTGMRIDLRKGLGLVLGLAAGTLLRPNPLGAVKLVYTQLVLWLSANRSHALLVGKELQPMLVSKFLDQYLPITLLIVIAIWFFASQGRRSHSEVARRLHAIGWMSLALMAMFLALSFKVASRSTDFYLAFAVLFLASVVTNHRHLREEGRATGIGYWPRVLVSFAVLFALLWSVANNVYRYQMFVRKASPPLQSREAAQWLEQNTRAGDIVFHVEWEKFAPLFFWNQHNYYINGMDPIFEYAYDEKLSSKHQSLYLDHVSSELGRTMLSVSPTAAPEDVHTVLRSDFHASAIVLDPLVNPRLIDCLRADGRFKEAFTGTHELVFQVLP
jgi:hypothetical protein